MSPVVGKSKINLMNNLNILSPKARQMKTILKTELFRNDNSVQNVNATLNGRESSFGINRGNI